MIKIKNLETAISLLNYSLPPIGIITHTPVNRLYTSARAYAPHVNDQQVAEERFPEMRNSVFYAGKH